MQPLVIFMGTLANYPCDCTMKQTRDNISVSHKLLVLFK
uniref:Uncharacterized protein n=1 Tax=Anguilla anguilla TaxID=7936 RepID=A0A0E9Q8H9_ANGAN